MSSMHDEKANETTTIKPYASGAADAEMVLIADADFSIALIDERIDPTEIERDMSRWVTGEDGRPYHPPVYVGAGPSRRCIHKNVREVRAKKGDRIILRRSDLKQLFSFVCTKCDTAGGARWGAECPRTTSVLSDEHRRAGHWKIFNAGRLSPDQAHVEDERFDLDSGLLVVLEHTRLIREGADPRKLKV